MTNKGAGLRSRARPSARALLSGAPLHVTNSPSAVKRLDPMLYIKSLVGFSERLAGTSIGMRRSFVGQNRPLRSLSRIHQQSCKCPVTAAKTKPSIYRWRTISRAHQIRRAENRSVPRCNYLRGILRVRACCEQRKHAGQNQLLHSRSLLWFYRGADTTMRSLATSMGLLRASVQIARRYPHSPGVSSADGPLVIVGHVENRFCSTDLSNPFTLIRRLGTKTSLESMT
jgi:hypothetical protein